MAADIVSVIARFRPKVMANAIKMRDDGDTFEVIAHYLTLKSGQRIGREAVRMWFNSVVLPAPRKPVRTVTGMRSGLAIVGLRVKRQRGDSIARRAVPI